MKTVTRDTAIAYIEARVGNSSRYDVEAIVEHLYDEYGTWDLASVEHAAVREAIRAYSATSDTYAR